MTVATVPAADPAPWDEGELYTRENEGRRLEPYDDKTGKVVPAGGTCEGTLTAGYGHTGPDVVAGEAWSQARCDGTFAVDYAIAKFAARRDLGPALFDELVSWRRYVLIDMAFEIGGRGLARFVKMLAAVREGRWQDAHDECLASELPRNRDQRNAEILRTGNAPA